jgi:hypothetical protein
MGLIFWQEAHSLPPGQIRIRRGSAKTDGACPARPASTSKTRPLINCNPLSKNLVWSRMPSPKGSPHRDFRVN